MKQGQKLTHLRSGKKYYVSRILKGGRFLIESNNDCVIMNKCDISFNFK